MLQQFYLYSCTFIIILDSGNNNGNQNNEMNKNQHAINLFKTMNEGNFTILGVIIL